MAKKKRKQRGDTMQDVTQKPQAREAEEAVETMEAAVETAMDADEAHEQAKEEMAQDTAAAEAAEALAAAIAKQEEYLAMAQRVQADFENFRRRNQNVRKEAFDDGARAFATTLLPVIDNLERAIAAGEESPLLEGVKMTLNQLLEGLKKFGLEEIPAQGEAFDPELHHAVMKEVTDDPGKVIEVFQKGYRVKEKIIRYAMVKVSVEE